MYLVSDRKNKLHQITYKYASCIHLTIDVPGLQVRLVAALEIAQPPRRPDGVEVALADELDYRRVLLGRLDGDEVHAQLPAQVARVQPTHLVTLEERKEGKNLD